MQENDVLCLWFSSASLSGCGFVLCSMWMVWFGFEQFLECILVFGCAGSLSVHIKAPVVSFLGGWEVSGVAQQMLFKDADTLFLCLFQFLVQWWVLPLIGKWFPQRLSYSWACVHEPFADQRCWRNKQLPFVSIKTEFQQIYLWKCLFLEFKWSSGDGGRGPVWWTI